MESRFKVITEGKLREGVDPEQFVQAFSQLFKLSEEQARKLLTAGRSVTLKQDVDAETAEKFRQVLTQQLGLEVHIEAIEVPGQISGSGLSLEGESESQAASTGGLSLEGESESQAASAGGMSLEGETGSQTAADSGMSLEGGNESPAGPDTSATSAGSQTTGRCPKCGSDRISGDDCLACGVIISRYVARQAQMAEEAPSIYAAPSSNVLPDEDSQSDEEFGLRRVDAGAGWRWIVGGWQLFVRNPGIWIAAIIIWYAIILISNFIPFIGPIAANVLAPVFTAGFMLGAHAQRTGGDFTIGHLFAGFSTEFGKLVQVGLLTLAGSVLLGLVLVSFGFGIFLTNANGSAGPSAVSIFILVLVAVSIMAVMAMAFLFVPMLVVFDGQSPIEGIKLSFAACWRNAIPFLVYGVIVVGLALVAIIPFGLGLIVLAPVVIASLYVSYRSIFYGDD